MVFFNYLMVKMAIFLAMDVFKPQQAFIICKLSTSGNILNMQSP
jgi:hypothetical protein